MGLHPRSVCRTCQRSDRGRTVTPARSMFGPGQGGSCWVTTALKKPASTARLVEGRTVLLCWQSARYLDRSNADPLWRVVATHCAKASWGTARTVKFMSEKPPPLYCAD